MHVAVSDNTISKTNIPLSCCVDTTISLPSNIIKHKKTVGCQQLLSYYMYTYYIGKVWASGSNLLTVCTCMYMFCVLVYLYKHCRKHHTLIFCLFSVKEGVSDSWRLSSYSQVPASARLGGTGILQELTVD